MLISNLIKKNRSILFLAATMIVGILLIGIQTFRESDEIKGDEIVNDAANTNFKELENKIQNLKNQNFNPTFYNTLATEIDASYQQELITSTAKNNLMSNLTSAYSNLVYSRCEFYLTGTNLNTSTEVLNWLQQLENITARNSKIDFYRTQIKAYDYYSNQFTKKVDYFCQTGSFDESEYTQLKTEANTMPRLNAKYKSNRKFNQIKQQCIANLEIAYRNWAQEDSDF
jgi:hypothetical protein